MDSDLFLMMIMKMINVRYGIDWFLLLARFRSFGCIFSVGIFFSTLQVSGLNISAWKH